MRPGEILRVSFRQIDDYLTCPLKYKYIHRLRVPLLAHHRVVYGAAIHKAIQDYFSAGLLGAAFGLEDLLASLRNAWVSEGFLSREHEERRLQAAEEALRRFHAAEATAHCQPTAVEEEFGFAVDATRVVGRYDLVAEHAGKVTILDFKTGDVEDAKQARRRAEQSLQLDIYSLAHLRTRQRLPDWVELRFVESGLAAGKQPSLEEAIRTEAVICEVSSKLRGRVFTPRPSYLACGQCAFRDICPHTARGPETE
jgi:DNA helicase-2/ATP-dependent DNA helicase PcrA